MDLDALISQQLVQDFNKQKKATKALLPQQQQQRSYANTKIMPKKLNLITTKFLIDEYKKEWMLWYSLTWPGPPMDSSKREASYQQLKDFYNEFISLRSYPGEEKYYELKHIDKQKMQIVFNVDKWIKDSFGNSLQKYVPPLSLTYKSRKQLPGLVYSSASGIGLNKFMSEHFKSFLKNKTQRLKHKEFGFIKKFSNELFDYSYSFRDNKFKATLKFSVVLASLAAYMIWKHKKDLNPTDVKSLQKKASNMKDIKKLDKYIKRL